MPVPKSKQGKPLGGIGAQAMTNRRHALVLDDRLLSKQYISAKTDAKVDDTAFSSSWSTDSTTAPSKAALHAKFNALSVNTSAWTQEDSDLSTSKTRTYDSGNVGVGSTLAYSAIDEKLVVDGNIKSIGDLIIGDDVSLLSDSAVLNFGTDSDTSLTHTDGTGLTLNSTNKLCFNDVSQFIQGSSATVLSIGATDEIDLTATTVQLNGAADINGAADVSGNLTVGGNATITGNLTVNGTATSIATTNVTTGDNIITLNNDVTSGTPTENAGIEVRRGGSATVALRWLEDGDKWQVTNDGTNYLDIATSATTHDAITLADNGQNVLALSNQILTVNDVVVKNTGDAITGNIDIQVAGSSDNCLTIVGGNSSAANAAVSIEGHLEATTKSFNIPHPLLEHKRLVYGSLEGPEHGMYARGSFDVEDERRKVAIDLPMYWSKMVHPDYTVNLTTYGDYNVWIKERDENGFWVETNSDKEWSFDWNVIGGRRDAKLVVEPDA
tara:strand:- start:634 stop:2124 length:1491 start_codon:yes stop_codon:yes gene_type:complete